MIIMRPDEANTSTKRKKALIDTFNLNLIVDFGTKWQENSTTKSC